MGVYIPNIEMPHSCADCKYGKKYGLVGDYYCRILGAYFTNNTKPPYKERPDDCPLVEVPPHGRLIDADALKAEYFVPSTTSNSLCLAYVSMETVTNAPTIIESEEET